MSRYLCIPRRLAAASAALAASSLPFAASATPRLLRLARSASTLCTVAVLLACSSANAEEIAGRSDQGSGAGWQAAYIDLDPPKDFKKGDRLVIRVEGSAEYVKVRLLPQAGNPSQSTGVVGGKVKVPPGGRIELTLNEARPKVKQISVHAGREAWGEVINPNGGDVRLQRIDVNP